MPDTKRAEPVATVEPKARWTHPERESVVRGLEMNAAETSEMQLANAELVDELEMLRSAQRAKYLKNDYSNAKADIDAISAAEVRQLMNAGKLSRLSATRAQLQQQKREIDEITRRMLSRVVEEVA